MYSNGRSEEILGRAIKKLGLPREELVIMTKVFFPRQLSASLQAKVSSDRFTVQCLLATRTST